MPTTAINALPTPAGAGAPNVPADMAALAGAVDLLLPARFASTAARDAAIPAPIEGMHCTTGTGATQIDWAYRGGDWRDVTVRHAWTDYTPTARIGGTAISLGNGVLKGRHVRRGKNILTDIFFYLGSTTSYGGASGALSFALPFAAEASWSGAPFPVGVMRANGASGGYHGLAVLNTDTTAAYALISTGPGTAVSANDSYIVNTTLTTAGHYVGMQFEYTAAA